MASYRCRHCGIEGPRDPGSYRIDDPDTCAGVWRMDGMSDLCMDERCCNCAKKHLLEYAKTYDMRACRHCKLRLEREQRAREAQRREQEKRSVQLRQGLVQDLVAALDQAGAAGDAPLVQLVQDLVQDLVAALAQAEAAGDASRAAAALVGGVAMEDDVGGPGCVGEKEGVDELEDDASLVQLVQDLVAALAQAGAAGDASRAAAALVGGVAMGDNVGGPGCVGEKEGVDELEADARLALALQEEENVRYALPAARLAADSPRGAGEKAIKEQEKSDLRAAVAGKISEQVNALVHLCCKFTNLFRNFDRKPDASAGCCAA
jgi:hypothetical protein